ncbi:MULTISPECIES: hypothetical protein [unclassified Arcicella]|uniref:hypothetical protein n=1 Tax=unclassified Arcicella TaxID=2644986 RepID=UPI002854A86F|nr:MULTISPECIES: hypothetical protein [unclassified Arcicella]MDR6563797.1 hypothetical protein [Arcicella sp. BE51]MDR6813519.1 hypothetical protein [Arcicella sp. BE140]MDR6824832.1 hypothetical protein [Arcicella sp. BE139]
MAKKSFSNDLLRDLHSESLLTDIVPQVEESITLSALNTIELDRLSLCESVIEKGLNTFVEVGNALFEIRNNKLYRDKFTTFESYCRDRWNLKRQRAYELMDAAAVVNTLSEISDKNEQDSQVSIIVPTKESHAAALSKVPEEFRSEVWEKALEKNQSSGKVITAKMIDSIAKELGNIAIDVSPEMEERKGLVKQIREKVKKAKLDQILVEIKGEFLIENDLVSVWQSLNQDSSVITETYKAYISLGQAEELGLIRKAW